MTALKFTQQAPDFILKNQDGENINLRQFRGKWVILYFYPKDDTPGCTTEAIGFTNALPELKKLQAIVLGISKDPPSSHCSFIKKQKLKVMLLSDEKHVVQEQYGVWAPKKFMGREFLGTVRTTFLIDQNGKIAHLWNDVKVNGHVDEVTKKLRELQQ